MEVLFTASTIEYHLHKFSNLIKKTTAKHSSGVQKKATVTTVIKVRGKIHAYQPVLKKN